MGLSITGDTLFASGGSSLGFEALKQLFATDFDQKFSVVHEDVGSGKSVAERLRDERAGTDHVHRRARVAEHLALERREAAGSDDARRVEAGGIQRLAHLDHAG